MLPLPFALEQGGIPLYQQLYDALVEQLRRGTIPAGSRLPGKRALAQRLGVAVNTVDTAYQMLVAEGYLESRPRSGFFALPVDDTVASGDLPAEYIPPLPEPPSYRFDLSTGGVDTALFPFRTWGRIQKELLYDAPELLSHGSRQGDRNLREAIGHYLALYRGVVCSAEQIVVGAGSEYLLGLAAGLFRGATAAVEEPGYGRLRTILSNNGVRCQGVSIDENGLSVDALRRCGASLCCVTPSHHFPTAVTMPATRRGQLLRWAAECPGRYILEDDYDAEFRFDMRPLPSLQGMAGQRGPVVYLCTFSKSLAPSIRIACMVLPPELLERYRAMYGSYANTVSRFEQQTLCRFLTGGHFTRHLSRMRGIYKTRMARLADALETALPGALLQGKHTGLHLLLTLPDGPGEEEMVRRAAEAGVRLQGLSAYYAKDADAPPCPPNTVILGYAALPDRDIPALADTLARAWRS
ncbi:PLP-dependent aminotransferase family protein [Pseudoflavonifractor phocaeensis]|uniref:MocR-like pyridoxine biosynthesis transcription factor PdxR n=1 Tax=Pseudoflavonifractor phocaeensis TaxID=1870988 RepID=UPI0019586A1F|nr:PLP-dependent aminotransferase family protein [Pseudoflavonifractor phocaeensis]MBM6871657.1 PLP-dependent aminotransferase family protein [Pseudoflavonifractor phocaeensis]MBM6937734.1 PLP-dependent aminotransferase family protein [Pseudoflavonifractor phocaeensis]